MSIYRIRKSIEEKKSKKEEEKEIWTKIFIAVCSSSNSTRIDLAIKWADLGTEEFLKKFHNN